MLTPTERLNRALFALRKMDGDKIYDIPALLTILEDGPTHQENTK